MAGLGRKVFAAGDVLAAADVDGYLMDQTVMKFANTSAVSSAVGTALAEGMTFYLSDTDEQVMYDGTRFVKQAAGENVIANGDFTKWTRGTSFSNPNTTNYVADRWLVEHDGTGATRTVSQQTFTPGTAPVAGYEAQYYLRYAVSVAGSSNTYQQVETRIEDIRTLAGQTAVISFWAKADAARTITILHRTDYGTGGSSADQFTVGSINATTSWVRYSITYAVPSVSGKTLGANSYSQFNFRFPAATTQTIDIWGVQLEAGSVATPFKPAGGNKATDTVTSGSAGFDGVLVSTNSSTNPSGSGTPAWAGYDVAGKNKVINGGFDFWQRGTTFAHTNSLIYGADRWGVYRAAFATGASSSRQLTGLTGYQYGIRVQRDSGNTGTGSVRLAQALETNASLPLAGQTVTLSFYARKGANYSDSVGNLQAAIYTGTGTDQTLWAGFTGATALVSSNAVLTTSWQRFSITGIAGTSATQMGVEFNYTPVGTAGAADYFEVTGVQVEAGSVATPFSRTGGTIQGELAACQRYYWRTTAFTAYNFLSTFGTATSTTNVQLNIPLPATLRVIPTSVGFASLTVSDGPNNAAVSAVTIDANTNRDLVTVNATSTGLTQFRPYCLRANNSTSAYFELNAEL